jgi:hypothetical protein
MPSETAAEASLEDVPTPRAGTQADTAVGMFEVIEKATAHCRRRRSVPPVPLNAEEWAGLLDSQGRVTDKQALWLRIYSGGIEPDLRRCAPAAAPVPCPGNSSPKYLRVVGHLQPSRSRFLPPLSLYASVDVGGWSDACFCLLHASPEKWTKQSSAVAPACNSYAPLASMSGVSVST